MIGQQVEWPFLAQALRRRVRDLEGTALSSGVEHRTPWNLSEQQRLPGDDALTVLCGVMARIVFILNSE